MKQFKYVEFVIYVASRATNLHFIVTEWRYLKFKHYGCHAVLHNLLRIFKSKPMYNILTSALDGRLNKTMSMSIYERMLKYDILKRT